MISIDEALRIVRQNARRLETETVRLETVCNRILAEGIRADMDLPPFDRSQMDGYAVKAKDTKNALARLKIVGEAAAGKGWHHELKAGEAVRIMTGAPVPVGANAVQKQELTAEADGVVEIFESVKTGQNIVRRASEIEKGALVLQPGERISANMIAVLASFGYSQIRVGKQPRVAILATGSEIVGVEETPGLDQIRNSNSAMLRVYAEACGTCAETLPIAGDEIETLKTQIGRAAKTCDCLILSGGVSVGKYDFTKRALRELGAEILFEKVALRPGKPTVFARLNDCLIFGLPGNPVSAAVTFNLFVRPALLEMQGAQNGALKSGFAILNGKLKGAKERDSFLPARVSTGDDGRLIAEPLRWGGSSDFVAFARADALCFVPQNKTFESGAAVKIYFLPN